MNNMHTKFEVSSFSRSRDILGDYKFKMGHVTWPRPFQGRFVICRLGLAMFNPRIKFEMSTITFVLRHPLGDLGVTHGVHLWLDGKRVVNFLLAIIAIFASSHGCGPIT